MRRLKLIPVLLMLILVGTPIIITPTYAQESPKAVPFEVWSHVRYATWSLDGTQFTFTTDYNYDTDPPEWYTYIVETGEVFTTSLHPIPIQLADVNKASLQFPDYALTPSDFSMSPSGQYIAYPSTNVDGYGGALLGIANVQTGRFVIVEARLLVTSAMNGVLTKTHWSWKQ